MPGSDELIALMADLDALPARQRREILLTLKDFERVQFEALVQEAKTGLVVPDSPLSSWLRDRLDGADNKHMTDAARSALRQIANDLDASTIAEECSDPEATPPTLIGTVSRLFSGGALR